VAAEDGLVVGGLDWLTAVPYAHRGLHDPTTGVPENTLAAFAAAADAGFAIELDVQRTADGEVVVVHDLDLVRVAGIDATVAATEWPRLAGVRLEGTDEHIPRLGEVLEVVAGRVPLMVELKNATRRYGPLESAVAGHLADYDGPCSIASFNPGTVGWFGVHHPALVRGQTAGPFADVPMPRLARTALRSMLGNVRTRPHYLSYELAGLPNRAVEFWRRGGRPLITWTVTTEAERELAQRLADQFVFERITLPRPAPAASA
jgi:glycerophosphoryl diester phosphodiesterase